MRQAWHRFTRARGADGFASAGLPAVVGSAALLLAAGLAVLATPRWHADAAAAEAALQQRAGRPRLAAAPAPAPPPDDRRLLAALPDAEQAPARLAALMALAARDGLRLESTRQSDVATAAPTGLPAQALRVSMQLHGRYPALRRLVAEALQHDDALLLDQLRLQRPQAQADELSAELSWLLLQRAVAAPVTAAGAAGRSAPADTGKRP
jgi:hypothetical protein